MTRAELRQVSYRGTLVAEVDANAVEDKLTWLRRFRMS